MAVEQIGICFGTVETSLNSLGCRSGPDQMLNSKWLLALLGLLTDILNMKTIRNSKLQISLRSHFSFF